eukprot:CAMPEP_0113579018 /NCGR_PEP_ID=MMETSP0015_2-20120614/29832_1 /TAXON_ID=2838 /ORGANISM="Odontella" /LENGTH=88 /DNA_ID=CAMNT_0000482945 /DNA_START=173 /DNA_END=439 /DNA_ORIENTATION=- /assembly_acc=CAM_ASM_000160
MTDPKPRKEARRPWQLASYPLGASSATNSTPLVLAKAYVTPCSGSNSSTNSTLCCGMNVYPRTRVMYAKHASSCRPTTPNRCRSWGAI